MREKDNQLELARTRLTSVQQSQTTSEGALTNLEEAIADKDKQIMMLKDQRDRAEQELLQERDLHERALTEYKMKLQMLEADTEKIQVSMAVRLHFAV